jgi:response regulator of citrate/malate metabolism
MSLADINILLLVEDDDNDILLTERKIQRAHLPVKEFLVAKTLTQAKAILTSKEVDVVLLDLNLGETRGLDTLKVIRPIYGGVLIVLTSIDNEDVGIEAIKLGAEDYLVKGLLTEQSLRQSVSFALVRHAMRTTAKSIHSKLDRLDSLVDSQ